MGCLDVIAGWMMGRGHTDDTGLPLREAPPLWEPPESLVRASKIYGFISWLNSTRGLALDDYYSLWRWSTTQVGPFWAAVWEYFRIGTPVSPDERRALIQPGDVSTARWFPNTTVNFAELLLRQGEGGAPAVVVVSENGELSQLTWNQLRRRVSELAAYLRQLGLKRGDVAVGYLPNIPEAIIAFLACASLGVVWSIVGQDYSPAGAAARFAQLHPSVLFSSDASVFRGATQDRRADIAELAAALPSLTKVIVVEQLGIQQRLPDAVPFDRAVAAERHEFEPLPFDTPLWVLFSSGTTGAPKGLVHSHGGIALEQAKLLRLQWDMGASDRFFWYTSPSWVLWTVMVGALVTGGSTVCYQGSPVYPSAAKLWQIAAAAQATVFGTSPGFLERSEDDGLRPAADYDLSRLRIIGSTGAPLLSRSFEYLHDNFPEVPVFSTSGGTDVVGPFVTGTVTAPVWSGEIPVRALGIAAEVWDESGRPVEDRVGELVITQPMPSMPLRLWNDPDGVKLRDTYFSYFPGYWRQGDWATVTSRQTVIVHGRSDATLNRNGVRLGPADIYQIVEAIPDIQEGLVVGVDNPDGTYWMPLFVSLRPGVTFGSELEQMIGERIARLLSPRHRPDAIIAVPAIPHTKTGKKLEVPIKRMLQGVPIEAAISLDAVDDVTAMQTFAGILRGLMREKALV